LIERHRHAANIDASIADGKPRRHDGYTKIKGPSETEDDPK